MKMCLIEKMGKNDLSWSYGTEFQRMKRAKEEETEGEKVLLIAEKKLMLRRKYLRREKQRKKIKGDG